MYCEGPCPVFTLHFGEDCTIYLENTPGTVEALRDAADQVEAAIVEEVLHDDD